MDTTLVEDFRSGMDVLSPGIRKKIAFRCRSHRDRRLKRMQVKQNPNEFAQFLLWMKIFKITRYAEVGCLHGGTLCLVDSFLRANFRNVVTVGVDILDRTQNYEAYHKVNHRCTIEITKPDQWVPSEPQDLIFIDTNHGKDSLSAEVRRLSPFAKYIGLHDVDASSWGSCHFWYNGEADEYGKMAYFHYGLPALGGPGIGVVKGLAV